MTTEEAIGKFSELAPVLSDFIVKIKEQKEYKEYMQARANEKKQVNNTVFMLNLLPVIMKTCDKEFYKALSIFFDKTEEEVRKQPLKATIEQVRALMADEDFAYFFSLWRESQTELTSTEE